jgi:hypothetical protein
MRLGDFGFSGGLGGIDGGLVASIPQKFRRSFVTSPYRFMVLTITS